MNVAVKHKNIVKSFILICLSILLVISLIPYSGLDFIISNNNEAQANENDNQPSLISLGMRYRPNPTDEPLNYKELGTNTWQQNNPSCNFYTLAIETRGGSLQMTYFLGWLLNGSTSIEYGNEDSSRYLQWTSSDNNIAKVSSSGNITAVNDGICDIEVSLKDEYKDLAKDQTAKMSYFVRIKVTGQTNAPFVSAISMYNQDGMNLDNGSSVHIIKCKKEELPSNANRFYAIVTVTYPDSGLVIEYDTRNGLLSAQTNGLVENVTWSSDDRTIAYINSDDGLVMPIDFGSTYIRVSSNATQDQSELSTFGLITIQNSEGSSTGGYHPQDKITIKAFYEKYPADLKNDNDERWVINKTFTYDQMAGQLGGIVTGMYSGYSSDSKNRYAKATGPLLSNILQYAGINLNGINGFYFKAAGYDEHKFLSYNYLYEKKRYYYPNLNSNIPNQKFALSQLSSPPILAYRCDYINYRNGVSTQPGKTIEGLDLNTPEAGNTAFYLLFGATSDGGQLGYWVYNINTIYVELSGGPNIKPDNPGTDEPGGGGGQGGTGSGDHGSGTGSGVDGTGVGAGLSKGTSGGNVAEGGDNDSKLQGEQGESSAGDGKVSGDGTSSMTSAQSGIFNVYQMLNRNDSLTQTTINPKNPWKFIVLPISLIFFLLGACYSIIWYKRQAKETVLLKTLVTS